MKFEIILVFEKFVHFFKIPSYKSQLKYLFGDIDQIISQKVESFKNIQRTAILMMCLVPAKWHITNHH